MTSITERLKQQKIQRYAEIEGRFACLHPIRQLRRRVIKDGRIAYYRQCIKCGNAGKAVPANAATTELIGKEVVPFDDQAERVWQSAKSAEYARVEHELNVEFRLAYEDYLRSSGWQERKTAVLMRADWLCEVCHETLADTAHHLTYEHLGEEPPEDLMAVCNLCHAFIHEKISLEPELSGQEGTCP